MVFYLILHIIYVWRFVIHYLVVHVLAHDAVFAERFIVNEVRWV